MEDFDILLLVFLAPFLLYFLIQKYMDWKNKIRKT